METSGFDPTDPRVQLEFVTRELRHAEEKIRQLEGDIKQKYTVLGGKENEIDRLKDQCISLKLKLELAKRDLKHTQELLILSTQKSAKKGSAAKGQAFLASVLFFLSSGFIALGINLLTTTPPNSLGWIMIAVAIVFYITGTILTTFLAFERGN